MATDATATPPLTWRKRRRSQSGIDPATSAVEPAVAVPADAGAQTGRVRASIARRAISATPIANEHGQDRESRLCEGLTERREESDEPRGAEPEGRDREAAPAGHPEPARR